MAVFSEKCNVENFFNEKYFCTNFLLVFFEFVYTADISDEEK